MTRKKGSNRGGLVGKAQRALRSSPSRVKSGLAAKSPSGTKPKTRTATGRTKPSSFAAPKKPSTRRTFGAPVSNTKPATVSARRSTRSRKKK